MICYWLLLGCFWAPDTVSAQPARPDIDREICLRPWTEIHRTGSPPCWILIQNTCLDQGQWQRWIQSGAQCWMVRGPLVARARRENSGHRPARLVPTLRARTGEPSAGTDNEVSRVRKWIERARERWDARLRGADASGVLTHLLTGTDSAREARRMFSLLGLGVLTRVLVFHGLALGVLFHGVARWGLLRVGVPVRTGIRLAQAGFGLGALLAWYFSGASPGALRPLSLWALYWSARELGIRWAQGVPLLLGWGIQMAVAAAQGEDLSQLEPWVERLGYSLAAWSAVQLTSRHQSRKRRAWAGFAAGCACSLLVALVHHWLAWGGFLISAVLLPIFSALLLPLVIAGGLLADQGWNWGNDLLGACGGAAQILLGASLEVLIRGPFQWVLGPGAALWGAVLLAAVWRYSRWTKTTLAAAIWLARAGSGLTLEGAAQSLESAGIFRWGHPTRAAGAQVEQLDVGQGDAALVRSGSAGHTGLAGLIDAGPPHALSPADWIGILSDRGLTRLDWVGLTHLDEDHAGGLRTIAPWIPIGCATTAAGQLQTARGKSWRQWLGGRDVNLNAWDGRCAPIEVLPPDPNDRRRQNGAMSVVFVPLAGGGFYLNAGDGDAADERRSIAWLRAVAARTPPGPRVLKISHHGSRFSSDPAFLRAAAPTVAWISVGLSNTYGHPAYPVLERLRGLGVPVRRTDLWGAISLK